MKFLVIRLSGCQGRPVKDKLGQTPLHLAVKQYIDEKMVKLLLDAGADPKSKDNSAKTVLDDSLRLVRFLVEAALG
jgi:ankyrin repeat protein